MKRARKTPLERDEARFGSARFVFRGVEYWVVGHHLAPSGAASELTPAEAHVLALLRSGLTYEQIAARRGRSRHTVAKQVRSVLRKLKVASQRELESFR